MAPVRAHGGKAPRIDATAFVAEGATVVGDVEIGAGASIWFGCVVRGDVHSIRIGARSNLQDLSVVHVTGGTHPTVVGEDVTVGHRVVLHGCTIHDRSLIGIGSVVLDGAEVGPEAMVGAGAVVPPGMKVPPRTLVLGTPARVARPLREAEVAHLRESARRYVDLADRHRREGTSP
jgi:carbonic anhydrase/acetyltransferase-like protein (isoleucine patch superfamily)